MGGVSMIRPVRSLFAAHLHQGGYLRIALAVATKLFEIYEIENRKKIDMSNICISESATNNSNSDNNSNNNINKYLLLTSFKPPEFLLAAWSNAMKLRVTARTLLQTVQLSQSTQDNNQILGNAENSFKNGN